MPRPDELTAILDKIAADTYSEQDIRRLRQAVKVRGDRNVVQVGGRNINLANARNIHIGDRIYKGSDADAIRDVLEYLARDQIGPGSLRGISGVIMTIGILISLGGMGVFAYGLLTAIQASDPTTGPPPAVITGFAVAFVGAAIAGIGQLVRGWERPPQRWR